MMRIPFWPKRRPTVLVVTFTQEIDLEAVAAGRPVGASGAKLVITCSCGEAMHSNFPWFMTKPNSVTTRHACNGCGNKADVIYTYDVKQPEAVA